MTFNSIFPAIGLSILFFGAARFIVSRSEFYQATIQSSNNVKYKTLDGLRGFLALGVFFHHAIVNFQYFQTGVWQLTSSSFETFLGQGAVAFFFMITGFLFWSKLIAEPRLKVRQFYQRRALRVLPAYWFSLALIVLIALSISGFALKVSLPRLLLQIGSWVICGIYGFSNANAGVFPDINYASVGLINASVQWTLTYELQFYLILPLLAWFVKPLRFVGLFIMLLILGLITPFLPLLTLMNFLFGMLAAYVVKLLEANSLTRSRGFSLIILALLAAVPLGLPQPYTENIGAIALMFGAFVCIASGNTLFGLLTAPASKYLGTISYSVYLLHGIVLFCVLRLVNSIYPIKGMNPLHYWIVIGVCGLLVISLAGTTYRFIEYPFLRLKPSMATAKKADLSETQRHPIEKPIQK